jgi:hypothetical protein
MPRRAFMDPNGHEHPTDTIDDGVELRDVELERGREAPSFCCGCTAGDPFGGRADSRSTGGPR